jgi:hypothetical protein
MLSYFQITSYNMPFSTYHYRLTPKRISWIYANKMNLRVTATHRAGRLVISDTKLKRIRSLRRRQFLYTMFRTFCEEEFMKVIIVITQWNITGIYNEINYRCWNTVMSHCWKFEISLQHAFSFPSASAIVLYHGDNCVLTRVTAIFPWSCMYV